MRRRVAELRDLFGYDDWANTRMLRAAAALTPEQYAARMPPGSASVRGTLGHIVAEEWLWLRRCTGEPMPAEPAWALEPSPQVLALVLAELRQERSAFLAQLTDAALGRTIRFRSLEGAEHRHEVGDMLFHIVTHSTYHRGQAALLIRQLGAAPPETDFVVYREGE